MNLPSASDKNARLKQQQKAREQRRIDSNAEKAMQLAEQTYPGEKWNKPEERIFVSERSGRDNEKLEKELAAARILKATGNTIYLLPENSRDPSKKVDAIVNSVFMELKTVRGGLNSVQKRFLESRSQSRNVFINITADLKKNEVVNQIAGARQGPKYAKYNRFSGGRVIIKLKDRDSLIYLNVDGLKWSKEKTGR
jgi:hypothetical protein